MRVAYTDHALVRMSERHIGMDWIDGALNSPDKLKELKNGRKQAVKRLNGDVFSVIYVIENNTIIVLTVHWGE